MKTITFYSYKGGVGRSLCLANIAIRLSEFNKTVCLLDFDLEAPGLDYKFSSYSLNKPINEGLVDYIYSFANEGILPKNINDYTYIFSSSQNTKEIKLIPAGNINRPIYWKKLASINWNELLYEHSSGISFFLDLKSKIRDEISPDFLLIDSRTGITEMSGITLSLLADDIVVVAGNNKENLDGSKMIIKNLLSPENNIMNKKPKITFVLSRVPFTEKPEDKTKEYNLVNKIKNEFATLIKDVNIIHSDRELEEKEQIKIGYTKDESVAQISRDYLNLFEKLTINDLSPTEVARFKEIKESEKYFQKAVSERNFSNKLEYINKAIELDSLNTEYFLFRAGLFCELSQYNAALEDCKIILTRKPNSNEALELKGYIYLKLDQLDSSIEVFQDLLKSNPNNYNAHYELGIIHSYKNEYKIALNYFETTVKLEPTLPYGYNGISDVYRLMGNYETALKYVYKAIEIDPDFSGGYATLAEINAHLNNKDEFYINLEKALQLDSKSTEEAINAEDIYNDFIHDERFLKVMEKYNINLENE